VRCSVRRRQARRPFTRRQLLTLRETRALTDLTRRESSDARNEKTQRRLTHFTPEIRTRGLILSPDPGVAGVEAEASQATPPPRNGQISGLDGST